jgi:hypothetical protein
VNILAKPKKAKFGKKNRYRSSTLAMREPKQHPLKELDKAHEKARHDMETRLTTMWDEINHSAKMQYAYDTFAESKRSTFEAKARADVREIRKRVEQDAEPAHQNTEDCMEQK